MEISLRRPWLIAAPTNTACQVAIAILPCKTSRLNRPSARGARRSSNQCSCSLTNGDSIHNFHAANRLGKWAFGLCGGQACSVSKFTWDSTDFVSDGNPVHNFHATGHRPLVRKGRHLAFPRVGCNARRRTFLGLHFFES